MYAQITTRCNMTCAHCCYECGPDGEDMTLDTFRKGLELLSPSYVSLGGGEPTLHPLFWQFLGLALAHPSVEYVWLATNGSQTETALALARLAKTGAIGCALSRDAFHDPIDPRVVAAFTLDPASRRYGDAVDDAREVRDVTKSLIRAGRAKSGREECPCPEHFVRPDGYVAYCGCLDAPLIATLRPRRPAFLRGCEEHLFTGECHRQALPRRQDAA